MDLLPFLLSGFLVTAQVVAGGLGVALLVALLAGIAADSAWRGPRWLARCGIEFFRGTSALIQLYWLFYALPLLFGYDIAARCAGMLVLGLNIGAYGAEVVRGALRAVPRGQGEAAHALGLSHWQTLWHVRLPQAITGMLPPAGNLGIELIKASALITFLALPETMRAAKVLGGEQPDRTFTIYILVAALYGTLALVYASLIRLLEWRPARRRIGLPVLGLGLFLGGAVIVATVLTATPSRVDLHTTWDWSLAQQALPALLGQGLIVTIIATVSAGVLAIVLGLLWAVLRQLPIIGVLIAWPLEAVRATPLLVQLFLLYFGVLPMLGWRIDALVIGCLGLGLHYSTYTAEVYRAAFADIPSGQREAATALGLSRARTFSQVLLPQAVPRALPALGNYLVALFKETPLLATITITELFGTALRFADQHFRSQEVFTLVGVIFLILSLITAAMIRGLERLLPVRHA